MKLPKIAVIIVNYNNPEDTAETIRSIEKYADKNYFIKIFLVNNGCTDGVSDLLAEDFPNITVINSPDNLGFGRGNNLGVKIASKQGYSHLLLLNNDATLTSHDFFRQMINSKYDIVAPVIKYKKNGQKALDYGGVVDQIFGRNTHLDSLGKADYYSGACLFLKTSIFNTLGGFDKEYFLYYEDVDFCLRAVEKGYTLGLESKANIFHHLSASTNKLGSKKLKILGFSHLKFCQRHLSRFAYIFYKSFNIYLASKRIVPYCVWRAQSIWESLYPSRNYLHCLLNGFPVTHIIGDSHVWPYLGKHPFMVHHLGGVTAYNLDNPNSKTGSLKLLTKTLKSIPKQKNLLIFSLGEIDCRLHIYYQFKKQNEKVTIDRLIKKTVEKYISFLKTVMADGRQIAVLSPTPTGTERNIYKMKFFADFKTRAKITKKYHLCLMKKCQEENIKYIDLYSKIVTKDGGINDYYRQDVVHLNQKIVPLLISILKKSIYNKNK